MEYSVDVRYLKEMCNAPERGKDGWHLPFGDRESKKSKSKTLAKSKSIKWKSIAFVNGCKLSQCPYIS